MREMKLADRVSVKAGVAMATVLEYMTAELLTISGAVCAEEKSHRIIPRHIRVAVRKDLEMGDMLGSNLVIPLEGQILKARKSRKQTE